MLWRNSPPYRNNQIICWEENEAVRLFLNNVIKGKNPGCHNILHLSLAEVPHQLEICCKEVNTKLLFAQASTFFSF